MSGEAEAGLQLVKAPSGSEEKPCLVPVVVGTPNGLADLPVARKEMSSHNVIGISVFVNR